MKHGILFSLPSDKNRVKQDPKKIDKLSMSILRSFAPRNHIIRGYNL